MGDIKQAPSCMSTKTVIIIEDEPETADMLAEMMRIIGYHVITSPGGVRSIDLISEKKPDIILLDQMMPEISGLEILSKLQADPRLRQIPVIIISAKSLPGDKSQGLGAGASFYLTKPVAFTDLQSAVERVILPS